MRRWTIALALGAAGALAGCDTIGGALLGGWAAPSGDVASPTPEPVTSNAWRRTLSPRADYRNMGVTPVPVFADPNLANRAGSLAPGAGGRIETCLDAAPVCRIARDGGAVWVRIGALSRVTG